MAWLDCQPDKTAALYRKVIAEIDAQRAADREAGPEDNEYTRAAAKFDAQRAAEAERTDSNAVVVRPKVEILGPKIDAQSPVHMHLGGAVLHVVRKVRGEDIMFTEKAAYRYADGIWSMEMDGLTFWLNHQIEIAANHVNISTNNRLINEARGWIQRQEALCRKHDEIPWDAHGMVPTKSGLVNPRTLEVRPIQPDDYCTWRIEAEFDPSAKCPWWLKMLDDVFADREPTERAATICVIQELLGAGLIDDKPRELSRALVFLGGSNFGKSGLIDVLAGLFGNDVNSSSIESLEGPHGMMQFLKRRPWVLHEAFDQKKWHFSSKVKEVVTGDPVTVNVKNGPLLTIRIRAPIFWGTNHPPQFKENTKAITNRLAVIKCNREFFDDKPVGAALEARRLGFAKPSHLVLKSEMPGVLAWALAGLKRALERGRLLLTKPMIDTIEEIHKDSNLVAAFLEECVGYDCDKMLSTPDFCLAFAAWWLVNKGESRQAPNNDTIGRAMTAMADPMVAIGRELRDNTRRYYAGIVLNDEGLAFHRAGSDMPDLQGKTANATEPSGQVNRPIPPAWQIKPDVVSMRRQAVTSSD
jgi:P4 family phage/plasmid primase-like protien